MSEYLYCLLYIDGWDSELQEPAGGGRCVGVYETIDAALYGLEAFRLAAPLMWGPGHLVITANDGELIHAPTLPLAAFSSPAGSGSGSRTLAGVSAVG